MNTVTSEATPPSILDRVGIPRKISWGFVGIFLFMVGTGLEVSWLSPYLTGRGLSIEVVAAVFSTYGVCVSVASWLSGVVFEIFGAKRTMMVAFLLFVGGTVVFVAMGVQQEMVWALFAGYAIKGFSYPLFSYSFLVWIAYRADPNRMSTAYGWFWFAFSGGMSVVGAYGSDFLIDNIGHVPTLWITLVWAGLGALAMIVLNRDDVRARAAESAKSRWQDLASLVTIMKTEPRLLIVLGVRIINTLPQFALPVFMPLYLADFGFSTSEWLSVWGTIWLLNIVFNLIVGFVGDKIGWKRTIAFVGGFASAISLIAFFYMPQLFGHNYWALMIAGTALGASIAGYVPLDAVTANLVESNKGASLSILNLGAGLSTLVGPLIVGVFAGLLGYVGVAWIMFALYASVGVSIWYVTPRKKTKAEVAATA
ncbi:MFS transporter [Amycolatopsis taiwanensis]|uniref:MFS transporter n=1 Tax=Amycolatopsis taiwanensis TaxID=342230 RepID=UPI0004B72264|nr:MFS transporter [Amycolatopsis taiwanensis]